MLNELKEKLNGFKGYFTASYTDRYIVGSYDESILLDTTKLLEMRIFNENIEYKLFRSSMNKELKLRIADDTNVDYLDELQLLDIDEKKSVNFNDDHIVFTTGGGSYYLPLDSLKNAAVLLRTYIKKGKNGSLEVFDFRIVKFTNKGAE